MAQAQKRLASGPRRGLIRELAAQYVGVSPAHFDKMVGDGRMPKPRILGDKSFRWDVHELDLHFDALPHQTDAKSKTNPWDVYVNGRDQG